MEVTEEEIANAMRARIGLFKEQADSITLEGVRRALEKDLALKTFALDVRKRFIKQCLKECLENAMEESVTKNLATAELDIKEDQKPGSPESHQAEKKVKESISKDEKKREGSPVLEGDDTSQHEIEETKGDKYERATSEDTIKTALQKWATYLKDKSENITMIEVCRLLEKDLQLERNALDSYRKFIREQLVNVLQSPKVVEPVKAVKRTNENKQRLSEQFTVVSSEGSLESLENEDEDGGEQDEVKRKKGTAAKGRAQNPVGLKNRKRHIEKTKTSNNKTKGNVELRSEGSTDANDGENLSKDGHSQSSGEEPVKKKRGVVTNVYGKRVEHLKSVIKSCGMSVPPSIYKRSKQAPENKCEAHLIKELKDILGKEGLSTEVSSEGSSESSENDDEDGGEQDEVKEATPTKKKGAEAPKKKVPTPTSKKEVVPLQKKREATTTKKKEAEPAKKKRKLRNNQDEKSQDDEDDESNNQIVKAKTQSQKLFRGGFTLINKLLGPSVVKLKDRHLTVLEATPFGNLVNVFIQQKFKEPELSRSNKGLQKLISTFNKEEGGFEISPNNRVMPTAEDMATIFGMQMLEEGPDDNIIDTMKVVKEECDLFVNKHLKLKNNLLITNVDVERAIRELAKEEDTQENSEILVRLIVLYLCQTAFFTKRQGTQMSYKHLALVESVDKINRICWPRIINEFLLKSIDKAEGNFERVEGCAFYLLYWFAEHCPFLHKREEFKNSLPRFVRWSTKEISKELETLLDKDDKRKYKDNRVKKIRHQFCENLLGLELKATTAIEIPQNATKDENGMDDPVAVVTKTLEKFHEKLPKIKMGAQEKDKLVDILTKTLNGVVSYRAEDEEESMDDNEGSNNKN